MKTHFLYWKTLVVGLFVVASVGAQTPDVQTGNPYTSIADWNTTYNAGAYNEVIFSNTSASEGSREGCDVSSSKSTTIQLNSSDTQWLDVNVPSGGSSTFDRVVFMVVGNSSSTTGWDHQVWASESVPFDVSSAKKIDFHFYGYKSGFCTPIDLTMPTGTKSIRIYRRVKSTDNGDGTYTLGSGDNTGSGQTMNFHYFDVYLITGPKIIDFSVAGITADIIDHSAKTIHVTVPFAQDITSLLPTFTLAVGTSFVDPLDETTAKNFTSPVTYKVTDGNKTFDYIVTVDKIPADTNCNIKTLIIDGQVGNTEFKSKAVSGGALDSIIVTMPYSSYPYTALKPVMTTESALVSGISPDTSLVQNFSSPILYTVTAEDITKTKTYAVKVLRAAASTEKELLYFSLLPGKETVVFNKDTIRVTVALSEKTNLTSIVPDSIRISDLATISPLKTAALDFQDAANPVQYTVTSEGGSDSIYTIKLYYDDLAPVLTSSKPAVDGSDTLFSLAGVMKFGFNELIKKNETGTYNITITGGTMPATIGTVTVVDSLLKFNFSGLESLTEYTVTIPVGMFIDLYGNPSPEVKATFKTADAVLHEADLDYHTAMDADNFEVPAFISPATAYVASADVKASSKYQYGAYVLAPGDTLTITTDYVGQVTVNAIFYALGAGRSYTIGNSASFYTGMLQVYDNNGAYFSNTITTTTSPSDIYITNLSTSVGNLYIPFISIVKGSTPLNESCEE